MEFKIDTKPNYVLITPIYNCLNANLTDELYRKYAELSENGQQNFIIDLHNVIALADEPLTSLIHLHELCYSQSQSLVFTGLHEEITDKVKNTEEAQLLNIAPTMAEAVDLVSMEILERDLFNEE